MIYIFLTIQYNIIEKVINNMTTRVDLEDEVE